MKRKMLFPCLVILTAMAAFGLACLCSDNLVAGSVAPALLCNQCSFGSNATKCVKCGSPWGKVPAVLCNQCGFGSNASKCVKCGSPWGKNRALLCNNCAFGSNARKCIKCGKHCN